MTPVTHQASGWQRFRAVCIYTPVSKTKQIQAPQLLDDQVYALDSAMLVARTAAEKGPVHKLRTTTRRMEAQLVLLEQLPGLPEHANEAAEVDRLLRSVRRAAAAVRDLDVQADMIEADMPDRVAVSAGSRGDDMRKEAAKLLKKLSKKRIGETEDLVATLRAESDPLARALRALQLKMNPLAEAAPSKLHRPVKGFTAQELSGRIQGVFAVRSARALHVPRGKGDPDRLPDNTHALQRLQHLNEETLHELRKAAKQCRYMAESLPDGSPQARKLAQRFEYLQEAGGRWHDWLMLEALAARVHGRKAALTERYRNHRDAALAEYHLQLALEFTTGQHRQPQVGSSFRR